MKSFTEFKTRIESDKIFAAKFVGMDNESQIIALAKAEGYDLEHLSDEELDMVAAGGLWGWFNEKIINPIRKPIIDVTKKILDVTGVDDFVNRNTPKVDDYKIHLTK